MRSFATYTRSGSATTETTDVSLMRKMTLAALGLTRTQTLRHVALPQAIATSVPPLAANVIFLIKETSVVSVVALPDLVYVAKDLIGMSYNTSEALILLVVAYLVILLPVSIAARLVEKKVRRGGFGN